MAKNAYINVRVDKEIKEHAELILNDLGINTSTAIDLFLSQIILNDGLPFEIKRKSKVSQDKLKELAEAVNLTAGKTYPKKFNKILSLYSKGDIDYDVALYAIKKEFSNG